MRTAALSAPMRADGTFRTDIQALRGFAVLLVLFYHAGIVSLPAGYLGVDVFFVISGYLMTRVITSGINSGTFRFSQFYWWRAKRLLPAAYTAFFATAVLAPFFLTALELHSFVRQLIGALTLSGNIVLYRQTGYFSVAADVKPLLHIWTLGVEEQYYLLLPAALVFIPRRLWAPITGVIFLSSLALCFALVTRDPAAAFYLLPTRAWELVIGSLAAMFDVGRSLIRPRLVWPAVATLFVIPLWPTGTPHPGIDAVLVCAATAVVLLTRQPALNAGPGPRVLAAIGNFSYSLYLVHWPIFAFLNNAYLGEQSRRIRILAIALALTLGYFLYRFVEVPVRRSALRFSGGLAVTTIVATVLIGVLPVAIGRAIAPRVDYERVRRINYGLGVECEYSGSFTLKDACRSAPNPGILVWGDSFAMHLVPGIIAVTNAGVLQATRSTCAPFLDFTATSVRDPEYPRRWSEGCLTFNRSVFEALSRTPSIKTVVLSSDLGKFMGPSNRSGWHSLRLVNGSLVETEASVALTLDAMRATAARIRALGKRVVVVAPPPSSNFNTGICLERKATGRLILGIDHSCRISVAQYHRGSTRILEYLKRLPAEAGVNVVDFDQILCDDAFCATELDGVFLYRNASHLSYDGSRLLAQKMNLGSLLQAAAR